MEVSDIVESMKRYPVAWISGFLSLLLGLYFYFTMGSLSAYENQLMDLEQEVEILKNNARQGADIEDDFNRFSGLLGSIEQQLMDHTQIATNNGYFYTFSQNHQVEISEVSQRPVLNQNPNPPQGDIWSCKEYSVIPFSMEVNGLLTDLVDMLYKFDESDRLIAIRSMNLTTTAKPEIGYMSLSLEVNVLGKPVNANKPGGQG